MRDETTFNDVLVDVIDFRIVAADTYGPVVRATPPGKAYCALCSRFRRGILYRVADELGTNKLALGHHRDDVIETMLLNLIHAGQLKSMPCKLLGDDRKHTVIRPLARVAELDLARYAAALGVPILPCNLCGSQSGLQRARMRELLVELEREQPRVRANMFAALGNVKESHLYDRSLTRASDHGSDSDAGVELEAALACTPQVAEPRVKAGAIKFRILP